MSRNTDFRVRIETVEKDSDGNKLTILHESSTENANSEIMGIDIAACVEATMGRGKVALAYAILNYPRFDPENRKVAQVMDKIENSTHTEREEKKWNALLAAATSYVKFWEQFDKECEPDL